MADVAVPEPAPSATPADAFPDPLSSVEAPLPSELEEAPAPPPPHKEPDPFAYRHYHPLHASCNKILAHKWDQRQQAKHLEKLKSVRPAIDNVPPKQYVHLEKNLKKKQLKQDRLDTIQRNNNALLTKMSHIMNAEFKEPKLSTTHERITFLRTQHRQQEQERIEEQNEAMQRRLAQQTGFYNRQRWNEERKQNLHYLQNIASYPKKFADMLREEEDAHAHAAAAAAAAATATPAAVRQPGKKVAAALANPPRPKGADVPPTHARPEEMRKSAASSARRQPSTTMTSATTAGEGPVFKAKSKAPVAGKKAGASGSTASVHSTTTAATALGKKGAVAIVVEEEAPAPVPAPEPVAVATPKASSSVAGSKSKLTFAADVKGATPTASTSKLVEAPAAVTGSMDFFNVAAEPAQPATTE